MVFIDLFPVPPNVRRLCGEPSIRIRIFSFLALFASLIEIFPPLECQRIFRDFDQNPRYIKI